MRNINIERVNLTPVPDQAVEIVERKGLGHPDFIADNLAEQFSIALSKEYLKEFGVILHHNVDKLDLVGGNTTPRFGGGDFKIPILILYSGRATNSLEGKTFDLRDIAIKSTRKWIKENFRFLDPDMHFKYQCETKPGAGNLRDLYERKNMKVMGANDTSVGSGYAPFTETEKLVLEVEKYMNSKAFKEKHPVSGEDVKIMGFREKNTIHLTIANGMIDRYVSDIKEYETQKSEILKSINEFAQTLLKKNTVITYLNTADKPDRGEDGCFLTVTGTSTEMGDDGAVGRGNRVNGLIPFNRPVSMEAAAGKNPVNHVGKIYNVISFQIARRIYNEVSGLKEVYVRLLSQIGKPIDEPKIAMAQIISPSPFDEKKVSKIIDEELENIKDFSKKIVEGKYSIA